MSEIMSMDLFTRENPVFECYAFYSSILIIKMIAMSLLTAFQRMRKKVFISPEDKSMSKGSEVKYDDPDVERVRRAHLNDVENIPIFLISGLLFVASKPSEMLAMNLFRLFTIVRILHTVVYAIFVVPQPARAIMFLTGVVINVIMIICIILKMHQF
ncbi:microsomal glutathione S-transferase 1-like [Adelges cooleyi]|uniref:microsomal glutathione S-transferase 1-like n=1 Tax=Adelges cooleyi TaxID=133065 RepID=UPI00217FD3F6|nr:microsomal glutathione S-transferase 1-like [Adelges cooleyi]